MRPSSYVPGFANDVFISYAHGDDPDWLRVFDEALCKSVRGRLGQEIRVWQDIKRLRVGQDWQEEIAGAIASTAVFLTVLSPSYQNSEWCSRELDAFLGGESADPPKAGEIPRLLKAVKIPWENDDHESFIRRIQHVAFFRRVDDPREYVEYAGESFSTAVQELGASITAVLRTMRRQLQKVFVASPADDVVAPWEKVRAQLSADRYDVRPVARLNAAYDDSVILREVESAVLTVHLFGTAYDKFAERQFKLASENGSRQLVWFSPASADRDNVAAKQWDFLEAIRNDDKLNKKLDWFSGSVQEMVAQVQSALRPRAPELPVSSECASIYLIHDQTTRPDAEFAVSLQSQLRQAEGFRVIFPPTGESATPDFHERHRQQLQTCDGVLLYRSEAPETWLEQYVPDVLYQGRKARAKSKAFLLDDPSWLEDPPVPVIRCSSDFRLSDLNTFLKPLRSAGGARAGH